MTGTMAHASSLPATAPDGSRHDVVITGGGLAGLTLALQLKQSYADLDILVLERRVHPVPIAAHKVGESTVEIGANYLSDVLGLKHHL
jgi:2-polyprenyl-6-methoxyphenol hydroxylase-like FAD-dependent oxidoreductase